MSELNCVLLTARRRGGPRDAAGQARLKALGTFKVFHRLVETCPACFQRFKLREKIVLVGRNLDELPRLPDKMGK